MNQEYELYEQNHLPSFSGLSVATSTSEAASAPKLVFHSSHSPSFLSHIFFRLLWLKIYIISLRQMKTSNEIQKPISNLSCDVWNSSVLPPESNPDLLYCDYIFAVLLLPPHFGHSSLVGATLHLLTSLNTHPDVLKPLPYQCHWSPQGISEVQSLKKAM